jgi:predicted Co/Zn/Cd cation transporter (cation efflux family)
MPPAGCVAILPPPLRQAPVQGVHVRSGIIELEQGVLRRSIAATLAVATTGVVFGLVSGSQAILFDGLFSLVDGLIVVLSLANSRLLMSEGSRRFQFGYWHIEPIVIAFNGIVLMLLCLYALLNAIRGLLSGGRELDFDRAIVYSAAMMLVCFGMYAYERRSNSRIGSQLIRLDMQSWLMSALIGAGLLLAFGAAILARGTRFDHLIRYADPAILAVLTAILFFLPVGAVARALREIFQVAPAGLDRRIRAFMDELTTRRGFLTYTSYVARVGRARFIEIYIVLPADYPIASIAELDAIRAEIGEFIGDPGPQRWLTITFTGDASDI